VEEMRNEYKILVGGPEKRPRRRIRRSWEDIIRMDLTEIGSEGVYLIHSVHKMAAPSP
jgi:hypothetical protein